MCLNLSAAQQSRQSQQSAPTGLDLPPYESGAQDVEACYQHVKRMISGYTALAIPILS